MSLAALVAALVLAAPPPAGLRTTAERSGFRRTGRYPEVERLCRGFERAFPGRAACVTFGTTPERRPMLALVASADGTLDPAAARTRGRPVVLVQAGVHAGEIDGKDAGFRVLRDLLRRRDGGALARVTVVFVPVYNVDGHERFGPNHRPNQNGPAEMGWRTTSQNLNLNRDYVKADAPETVAMLGLLDAWDPIVYLDLHVTDGAEFRHELAYLVEPTVVGDAGLAAAGRELRDGACARLARAGHLPIGEFYPAFRKDDDPASGFEVYVAPPRFGSAYWRVRHRLGVLVETHAWKDYRTRVRATEDAIRATLDLTAARGAAWRAAADAADAAASRLGGEELTLAWTLTDRHRTIDFLGYAYTIRHSEISGGPMIVYDRRRPQVWKVPLYDEPRPSVTVRAPRAGYLVAAGAAGRVAARLRAHGIVFSEVRERRAGVAVASWRADGVDFGATPYEGRQKLTAQGAWHPDRRDVEAGSLFVPIAQPRAELVVHLLEPAGPDSLLSWGFFNAYFEQKEYMEPYVAEQAARDMLKDPAVRADFERLLREDEGFARDPRARLRFFYRRHPSWDERHGLYPVYRLDAPL